MKKIKEYLDGLGRRLITCGCMAIFILSVLGTLLIGVLLVVPALILWVITAYDTLGPYLSFLGYIENRTNNLDKKYGYWPS